MRLGIDIGGTFTDLVAFDPDRGEVTVSKALNSGHGPEIGVRDALHAATVEAADVTDLTHGTTVVTNLLIERNGATVGLICSRGFRDVLEIQRSWRERTFDLRYQKTPPLIPRERRLEVAGRIDVSGREVEPLDEEGAAAAIRHLVENEHVDALTVALYNAYVNPVHERRIAEIALRVAPTVAVTLATDVDPRIGEFERTSTSVLNAMAVPRMQRYVDELATVVTAPIRYMHSAGGVIPPAEAGMRPIQLALSGPAAGVLAARRIARSLGFENAITMDMGGTSCDVSLIWQGELRHREEIMIQWGVPARVRALDVHTVGAGGGSIAWRDSGGSLRVGPRSAGALPGPACYGRGGTVPTVTDANMHLGILPPSGLLGGRLPLDANAAERALTDLGGEFGTDADAIARGIHDIVNANMAQAIREITVRQGIDPRRCALVSFGGAAAQHATGVAAELGIADVVVPAQASVLSAVGLLTAESRASATRSVLARISELGTSRLEGVFADLAREATARVGQLSEAAQPAIRRFGGLRYVGQSHELSIALDDADSVAERFEAEHEQLFGTRLGDPIEIVDVWVEVVSGRKEEALGLEEADGVAAEPTTRTARIFDAVVPVHQRDALAATVAGPCLVEETHSVTVVPEGAEARLSASHLLIGVPV